MESVVVVSHSVRKILFFSSVLVEKGGKETTIPSFKILSTFCSDNPLMAKSIFRGE